ncbi:MAG: flavodoxin domain-containing protein [Oscillospiraceae bacterium]|jgi:menaquinone-dependent protoporphyrinogen oxidase|nr:flavodoxin domain-containing protein [Oscillospiraceae bacterium]
MHTLIAYSSKYGATKACAEAIAAQLNGQIDLCDLDKNMPDLTAYDAVIVGSSVYMTRARKAVRNFCKAQMPALLGKRLGLFLCCVQDLDKTVSEQMQLAFPKPLRDHAAALGALGGQVDYTKLSRMDGMIMNMVAGDLRRKTGKDVVSTIAPERIARFAELMKG